MAGNTFESLTCGIRARRRAPSTLMSYTIVGDVCEGVHDWETQARANIGAELHQVGGPNQNCLRSDL